MSTPRLAHLFPLMIPCLFMALPVGQGAAQDQVRPRPSHSGSLSPRFSDSLSNRLGSRYEFKCKDEIHTGETHSIDFILRANISATELGRLISELSAHTRNTPSPCLIAELSFLDTNKGIVVKEITRPRQKLLAGAENRWNWQIKGLKPGHYLLTLTLSVCAGESERDPLVTPLSISHRLRVVGAPVEENSQSSAILFTLAACGLVWLIFKVLIPRFRDRKIKVAPPVGSGRIFASYAKEDRSRVTPIVHELEAAGHQVWMDRDHIEHAASWRAEIVEALSQSACVVFFASKHSYESVNVGKELEMAHEENLLIIPVLLESCEAKGASRFVVAGLQRIDARKDTPKSVARKISLAVVKASRLPVENPATAPGETKAVPAAP